MTRRRHTPEQIVRKVREADRLLNEGADIVGWGEMRPEPARRDARGDEVPVRDADDGVGNGLCGSRGDADLEAELLNPALRDEAWGVSVR